MIFFTFRRTKALTTASATPADRGMDDAVAWKKQALDEAALSFVLAASSIGLERSIPRRVWPLPPAFKKSKIKSPVPVPRSRTVPPGGTDLPKSLISSLRQRRSNPKEAQRLKQSYR